MTAVRRVRPASGELRDHDPRGPHLRLETFAPLVLLDVGMAADQIPRAISVEPRYAGYRWTAGVGSRYDGELVEGIRRVRASDGATSGDGIATGTPRRLDRPWAHPPPPARAADRAPAAATAGAPCPVPHRPTTRIGSVASRAARAPVRTTRGGARSACCSTSTTSRYITRRGVDLPARSSSRSSTGSRSPRRRGYPRPRPARPSAPRRGNSVPAMSGKRPNESGHACFAPLRQEVPDGW